MIIKNSNLRSFLYSQKYKILGIIIAIILALMIIQILNNNAKKQIEESIKNAQNSVYVPTNSYKPEETIISRKRC